MKDILLIIAGILMLTAAASAFNAGAVHMLGSYQMACGSYTCGVIDTSTGKIVRTYAATIGGHFEETSR